MALIINDNKLPVQTVAPTLSIGEVMIQADRRSTDKEKLTDAERIRRVVLPAGHWGTLTGSKDGVASQSLTDVLREALREIGNKRLKDALNEAPMLREVALADYTVAELLKWSEDTATSRGSLTFTRDEAIAWYDASETRKAQIAKYVAAGNDEKMVAAKLALTKQRFATLAAKNHGMKLSLDAATLMALIVPADIESGTGLELVGRLQHVIKILQADEAENKISMSDL